MPCVNPDGEVTEIAKKILQSLREGISLEKVAEHTETPLYRIRMAIRELVDAGLAEQRGQWYVITETGLTAINKLILVK